MSNTVPVGWRLQSLADVATFVMGQAPAGADCNKEGTGIPFVKAGEFTARYPVIREWTTAPHKLAKSGDVLICVVGATAGKLNLGIDCAIGRSVAAIRPEKTSTLYLYNFMQQHVERLRMGSSGSAQGVITTEHLKNILAPFPPLPEQQKIAAILSSVDDVIEKTRAQIDKLKDLKTGMMQELLTKGIGHTEFKDSPVGRIPASWAVKMIGDLGSVVTGSTPKTASREYYGGSIPFISPSDINHSMYIQDTVNSLTEAGLKETRELPPRTVCVVCIGSTIGKTGITTFRCATNQQVNAVICRGTHPEFVYYLLTYYSKVIKAEAGTQAVPIINKSSFSALPVQLPGYDEQVEIGNSLASIDSQTSLLERKLQSANSLKKALMQDLLTGKVRVKVDQKESAVA
ncbi:MAG: restriction endonuclease subunit S [Marinobacter sp.]|uniref:restriction endonuclease subunit S n=1 Tax=Marinobacter sp. TaxID=50741 RepID=UPI00396D511A